MKAMILRTVVLRCKQSALIPIPFSFVYVERFKGVYCLIYDTVLAISLGEGWETDGSSLISDLALITFSFIASLFLFGSYAVTAG